MPDLSMSSTAVVVLMGLVAGHLMIDFACQTDNDIRLKRQFRVWVFAKHGFVHAAVAYCLSGLWLAWQIPVVILLVHPVVDFVKERGVCWLGSPMRDGSLPVRWNLAALLADPIRVAANSSGVKIMGKKSRSTKTTPVETVRHKDKRATIVPPP